MLFLIRLPRVVAALQLWAEISERLRRIFQTASVPAARLCAREEVRMARFTVPPSWDMF